jgi:hypothetical protein
LFKIDKPSCQPHLECPEAGRQRPSEPDGFHRAAPLYAVPWVARATPGMW